MTQGSISNHAGLGQNHKLIHVKQRFHGELITM